MSHSSLVSLSALPPVLAALNGGEVDDRFLDCSADLGPADLIPTISAVSITVARKDGFPTTTADLQLAAQQGLPLSLDATRQIVNVGVYAPQTAGGSEYLLTLVVNRTQLGRLYVRSFKMFVVPGVTTPVVQAGTRGAHVYNVPLNAGIFVSTL